MNRTLVPSAALAPLLMLVACSGTPPPVEEGMSRSTGGVPGGSGGAPAETDGGSGGTSRSDAGPSLPSGFDSQRPAQGGEETRAWLETGAYLDWSCEAEAHPSRPPSPHGFNRICSNDVLAAAVDEGGEWPAGAAGVKEFFDSPDAREPTGYSVYLKLEARSEGGANWYWYERFPSGLVTAQAGATICTRCHGAAGRDAANTPTAGARDYVFTPVR